MRLSRNLFAGLTNSAWTAIAGVVATPFYVHFLGIESYGLVGFFTTLLTLLTLLDMGLSPTMNREVARYAAEGDMAGARYLLRSLEILYWAVAVLLGGVLFLAASWIGKHWLQSTHLASTEIVHSVMLMGLVVTVRWPIILYSSTLMGAQRLAVVSGISSIMVAVGAVGAILVLAVVSPSIQAFFLWQAFTGLSYVIVIRRVAWKVMGGRQGVGFRFEAVRRIWRFSAGLGLMTVTGIFLTQFDKILLSKMIGLAAYGRYMLASLLASGLYLLVTPVFNVLYPRFSALVAVSETEHLAELYALATRLLATLVFPVATAVALFSEPLVWLWTHNSILATQVAPILSLLILGAGLHGVMFLPYALQLAYGQLRLALTINIILIVIYVPLIVVLTRLHAQAGAAIAWLILHCFYLVIGTWLTHRYLLKGEGFNWLIRNVGIPLCASLLSALFISRFASNYRRLSYEGSMWACVLVVVAVSLSLAWSPALRRTLLNNFGIKSNRT